MRDREPVTINDEADHDLFAIGAMIAGIAPLGLLIPGADPLKISRAEVVEIDGSIEIEQAALACN